MVTDHGSNSPTSERIMRSIDFLLTPSMQRVLRLVLSEPGRTFTLSELVAQAGSGNGGSQRQIERLLEAGVLLEGPRQGIQRSIRVNTKFFIYPELRGILHKAFGRAQR
jgi:hypothetical protein